MVCYHILKIIFMAVPSFQLPFPQVTTWKLLWSDPLKKSTRFLSYFYSFVFFGFGTGLNHWEHPPYFSRYLACLFGFSTFSTKSFNKEFSSGGKIILSDRVPVNGDGGGDGGDGDGDGGDGDVDSGLDRVLVDGGDRPSRNFPRFHSKQLAILKKRRELSNSFGKYINLSLTCRLACLVRPHL